MGNETTTLQPPAAPEAVAPLPGVKVLWLTQRR